MTAGQARLARFAAAVISAAILVFGLVEIGIGLPLQLEHADVVFGHDIKFYLERTNSWLSGTGFYLPWQLTGKPYVVEDGGAVYPPTAILLFLPFTVGVPLILWWIIPLALIVVVLVRRGVAWWAWPILALVVAYPRTATVVFLGNPSMWVIAGALAGLEWGWPAAVALIKPVFAPLAFIGVRTRSWWVSIALLAAVSIPFGTMWLDYLTVLQNARTSRGMDYVLGEWPIALALLAVAAPIGGLRRQSKQPGAASNGGDGSIEEAGSAPDDRPG